jgi:transposase
LAFGPFGAAIRLPSMPGRRSFVMEGPVIALDVSKGSSHVQGFKSFGVPLGKVQRVHHSREGLSVIKEAAESLGKATGEVPSVALESTGVYSACVVRYCQSMNLAVYLISPLASAKMRKAEIRPTKTDAIDPSTIAKVFYSRELRRLPIQGGGRDSLRDLSRIYGSESRALAGLKNEYRRLLDLIWPCLDEAWADPFSSVPMAIVERYGHPEILATKPKGRIATAIFAGSFASKAKSEAEAAKAKEYSKTHVSGVPASSPYVAEIRAKAAEIMAKEAKLESLRKEMGSIADSIPEWRCLKTVPCCSGISGLRILAEIGDVHRFATPDSLVAYAGLDPCVSQSGEVSGKHLSITKKGNPVLRQAAYLVVKTMHQFSDCPITGFYDKKKSSGLSDKAAAVAASNKLLRVIYSVLVKKTEFVQG